MDSRELRLGNYYFYQSFGNVVQLDSDILISLLGDGLLDIHKIQPILLTEEWLLRFGAIDLDATHYKQFRLGERLIVVRDGKFVDYGSSVILEYVHTLQNFIFAMTNDELTIKSN